MASHYTVVQYVPDPATDERINVGVLTYGDGQIRCRFLRDWRRVEQFGGEDIGFLRDLARDIQTAAGAQPTLFAMPGAGRLDEETLRRMIGRWRNSVQFTPTRASLLKPAELLDDVAGRFLRESKPRAFRPTTKPAERLAQRFCKLIEDKVILPDQPFEGARSGVVRRVDFYADSGANLAIDTLRLAIKSPHDIIARADAEAFKLEDILEKHPVSAIVVCELASGQDVADANGAALRILKSAGTRVEVETDLEAAVDRVLRAVDEVAAGRSTG